MTATASVSLTGDPYVDGILTLTKRGAFPEPSAFRRIPPDHGYAGEPGSNSKLGFKKIVEPISTLVNF